MASLAKSFAQARPTRPAPSKSVQTKSTSVAEAKANFSSLLNSVEHSRAEIIVMRRGVPIAKIVPMDHTAPQTGYGWMRGSARELGDIVGPTGEEWTVGDE